MMRFIWMFLFLITNCFLLVLADLRVYVPKEASEGDDWGGLCRSGRRQSPIDLDVNYASWELYPSLYFQNFEHILENAKIRNTGLSLQIDIPADQEYFITGGGLPGRYKMDQMHFHWLSEHTISDQRFGLELHMVMYNQLYGNFSEAIKRPNGVAVLGVLFHISDRTNPLLQSFLDSAVPIRDKPGQSNAIDESFSPMELVPKNRSSYFRYNGSLTTPPCSEGVIWTVFVDTIPVSMEQVERFQQAIEISGTVLAHNNRSLQPRNNRTVIYVENNEALNAAS